MLEYSLEGHLVKKQVQLESRVTASEAAPIP